MLTGLHRAVCTTDPDRQVPAWSSGEVPQEFQPAGGAL